MKHGYTNQTAREASGVRKSYEGPDASARLAAELRALRALTDRFPVPPIIDTGPMSLTTKYVPGGHGQDLIDSGHGPRVLAECGAILRRLHQLDPCLIDPAADDGTVIMHGDFGPNNVLFDSTTFTAVAVLDWEYSGMGEAIADIAWCEWIVRMHHESAIEHLDHFFEAYQYRPPWPERQAAMIRRCEWFEAFARRWDSQGSAADTWRTRTRTVRRWIE